MGFLSPWFLAGVLAVGIPIWVHLIRREQAIRLPFSSLMFLQRIPIKTMSRKRLKYFLLLSMRMLILVLLALAFARPYFPWLTGPLAGGASDQYGVILLDTSMSMQYGDRWERALAAADEAIGELGNTEEAQIVTFASDFQILNLPTSDKAALRAALEQAEPTAAPTSYTQAFRAAERIAEEAGQPLSVVLITDLQKAGLSTGMQGALPPVAEFRVVNVAEGESPNWTVEGVRSRRTVYRARYPDRLLVQLRGSGTAQATKEVTFTLLGREIERTTVGIPASGVATVAFEGFDVPLGENPAEITIGPGDDLPLDDTFYFTLERREANRVLFLRESGAEGELYYLRNALAAETDSPFLMEARSPAVALSVPLREYAMVILSNVRQLPGAVASQLREYVEQGRRAADYCRQQHHAGSGRAAPGGVAGKDARKTADDARRRTVGAVGPIRPRPPRVPRFAGSGNRFAALGRSIRLLAVGVGWGGPAAVFQRRPRPGGKDRGAGTRHADDHLVRQRVE